MSLYASVNGVQITTARLTFPQFGAWHGDIILALPNAISGNIAIQIGDLTLVGHSYRAASFAGARGIRVVGGHGGWQQQVSGQAYEMPSGVMASVVLKDVTVANGETLTLAADKSLGAAFVRERCVSSRVLRQIVGDTWWIDIDGTTKTEARSALPITTDFQTIEWSGARGRFVIATEALHDWMPGRTFTSPTVTTAQTISSSTLILGNDGVARVEILTNTAAVNAGDRVIAELRSLIREDFPSLTFFGVYEYSVQAVGSGTVDGAPTDTTLSLPPITLIPEVFPFMTATLRLGDLILVAFINGNPSRPTVVSAPPTSTAITIGDSSPSPIARVGDTIQITSAQILAAVLVSPSGAVTLTNPLHGTITSGSGQVQSG